MTETERQLSNEVKDLRGALAAYMGQIATAIGFLCGPQGKPEHFNGRAVAANALLALSDDQRLELFAEFCRGCGRPDPSCQCENDE